MKVFYERLCNIEIGLAIICLLVTVFTLVVSAFMRSLGIPINWALDIALLSFAWCAFLGADIAFREGEFVNVDLLFQKMPKGVQTIVELIIYIAIFIFLCALIYLGSILSVSTWHRSFQGIPTLSYTWVTLSIPVTSLMMLITLLIRTYNKLLKNEKITA
ncbi:TRAP transporter small permease subunit [bacterium LRH843]|nr:TRAP transporter small permease subunit [bacterium LRH843]